MYLLKGIKIDDPKAEFNKIDKNKGGFILFDEFLSFMTEKNIDYII